MPIFCKLNVLLVNLVISVPKVGPLFEKIMFEPAVTVTLLSVTNV